MNFSFSLAILVDFSRDVDIKSYGKTTIASDRCSIRKM